MSQNPPPQFWTPGAPNPNNNNMNNNNNNLPNNVPNASRPPQGNPNGPPQYMMPGAGGGAPPPQQMGMGHSNQQGPPGPMGPPPMGNQGGPGSPGFGSLPHPQGQVQYQPTTQAGPVFAGIPVHNQVGSRPIAPPPTDKPAPSALGGAALDQARHGAIMTGTGAPLAPGAGGPPPMGNAPPHGAPAGYGPPGPASHHSNQQQQPGPPPQGPRPSVGPPPIDTNAGYGPQPTTPTRQRLGSSGNLQSPQRLNRTLSGRTSSSPRIDPQQIPGPVGSEIAADENVKLYSTKDMRIPPPPSTISYVVNDEGNASPRFMRMSLYTVPTTKELLHQSRLPLSVVMQPLADVGPGEEVPPLVNFGEAGPLRCQRCRAYINPFVKFIDGGQRYVCSLCSVPNEVPREYYCNIDGYGVRRDIANRPELSKGSVEFAATKAYEGRPVTEPVFLFLIDVSSEGVANGMLGQVAMTIQASLDELALEDRTRVGIITYDSTVHFYPIRENQKSQEVHIISEIEEPFVPLPPSFLVNATLHRPAIDALLSKLPKMYAGTQEGRSAFGAALAAAHQAIESTGGRIMVFQSSLPNFGPGALARRDNPSIYGTEKEKALFAPQSPYYEKLGAALARSLVSVDLFLFPKSYIDVATLSVLSRRTNGYIFFYNGFRSDHHGAKLFNELSRCLSAVHAYDGLLRVRASGSLTVEKYYGNLSMASPTDVSLPALDARTTVSCSLGYTDKLDENKDVIIQCALLYTAANGERRIRVHNICLPVSNQLTNVFRTSDLDGVVAGHCRQQLCGDNYQQVGGNVRDALMTLTIDTLTMYRKYCSATSAPGQLILPETLKLMPLYSLAFQKSLAVRATNDVSVDKRMFYAFLMGSLSVDGIIRLMHPRMYSISQIEDGSPIGLPNSIGESILPPQLSLTAEKLDPREGYLLEDGQTMYLWVGRQIASAFLSSVFGVMSTEELPPSPYFIPQLQKIDNGVSKRVRSIIETLEGRNQYFPQLCLVRQGDPAESFFLSYLVEDRMGQSKNYVDYLCHLHKVIQSNLANA